MAEDTFAEAYRTHGFVLEVEGVRCPVTKVTGLSEGKTDVIEQSNGGDPFVHKIASGVVKFETLTVERLMDGSRYDMVFQKWFADMFQLTGKSGGSSARRNGAVIKLENGQEVLRFVFFGAFVTGSTFADLEAASTNLWKQTVTLEHSGMQRVV